MSAISNITVYDGAATPVAHTFAAEGVQSDGKNAVIAKWRETGLNVPVEAQPRIRIRLERLPTGVYKVERWIEVPVMESVSGQNAAGYTAAPKIAYVNPDYRRWFFSPRSDAAGRRLVKQLGTNLDGNVATSVAAPTTGVIDELVSQLLMPT